MDVRNSGEKTGKGWAEAHPGAAEEVRNVVMGDFASRECHKERRPDDIICPQCHADFVNFIELRDPALAAELRVGLGVTRSWIDKEMGR